MVKVIGLTGSIAVGKSTVTHYLLTHGYLVLDADMIAHEALEIGKEPYQKVVNHFDCLNDDLTINRKKLGELVFHDSKEKVFLESCIHPYVIERLKQGIAQCHEPLIFLDIPLLYETHLEYLCDKIIVVYVSEGVQCARLMARNHIDEMAARHLMSQQISIEEKKMMADYIIDNQQNFEDLYKDIERVLQVIKDEVIYE